MSEQRRKRALAFLMEKFFIAESEAMQEFRLEEDGLMTACIVCISLLCIAVLTFAMHRSKCLIAVDED